jgi:hypothetical protein
MKHLVFILLFTSIAFGQNIKYYKHGYEGILYVGHMGDSTLIYSHHMAKSEVMYEVGKQILKLYAAKKVKQQILTIETKKATILGLLKVKRQGTLIHLEFIYQRVRWKNGILEVPSNK